MNRQADKWVIIIGVLAGALLLLTQIYSVILARAAVAERLDDARNLARVADSNTLSKHPRDPATQSGRVFSAWEALPPVAEPLSASHFYPNPGAGN